MAPEYQELSNGWTQYQKLVLAELTRHETSINILKEENVERRIVLNSIEQKLETLIIEVKKFQATQQEIEDYQTEQDTKFASQQKILDDKFNEQKLELEKVKWKITTSLAIFIFIINAAIQLAGKLWKWW